MGSAAVSAETVVLEGRAFNERQMTSTGVVRRATGEVVTDPDTLVESPSWAVVYEGRCNITFPKTQPGTAEVPGGVVVRQDAILSLPVDALGSGDVDVNDVWECTGNPMDAALVGVQARVAGVHRQTYATARRFPVEVVS